MVRTSVAYGSARPDIDECATANGGCSDVCTNTPGSSTCACSPTGLGGIEDDDRLATHSLADDLDRLGRGLGNSSMFARVPGPADLLEIRSHDLGVGVVDLRDQ